MYTLIDKNDKYIEMAEGENKMLVPSRAAIIVDDESTITTVKTIASRRTLASIDTSTPPTPTFQGKWLATYSDSHTESAECDSTSAITGGEINKTNLVSVKIGDCVTSIGGMAFYGCTGLTGVTIEATTPPTLGMSAFVNTNNCPIYVPESSVGAYQTGSWILYAGRIQAIPTN